MLKADLNRSNRCWRWTPKLFGFLFALSAMTVPAFGNWQTENRFETTVTFGGQAQTKVEDLRRIEPGQTVSRRGVPNEVHGWELELEAGTTVEITFPAREITFELTALTPDDDSYSVPGNKVPAGSDLMMVIPGPPGWLVETTVVVAERTGKYILRTEFSTSGNYSFTIGRPRPTTSRDRDLATAGKLLAKIQRAFRAYRPISEVTDDAFERVGIYRRYDDKKSLARSLVDVADALDGLGRWSESVNTYKEAITLFRSLDSPTDVSATLAWLAIVSEERLDFQFAFEAKFEALSIARAGGNKGAESGILNSAGVTFHLIGDKERARQYYEQALAVLKSISPDTVDTLNWQTFVLGNLGNLLRAVEANEIPQDIYDPPTRDDRLRALEYYLRALAIANRVKTEFPGATGREAYTRLQIGNTYRELGNYDEAERYLITALGLYTARSVKEGEIYCHLGLGNLFIAKGDFERGIRHYETSMELMATIYAESFEAKYLRMIAAGYAAAGRTDKALAILERTIAISRERAQSVTAASALYDIATIERDRGNFANARSRIEEAISIVESIRARITSRELRTSYFATARRYYEFHTDLMMMGYRFQPEKGLDLIALETSERSKSRSLLDLLALARIDGSQGIDPDLLRREREIRDLLNETAYRQNRLLLGKHAEEEAGRAAAEILELSDRYSAIRTEIRERSPKYASLTEPTSLNVRQIQGLLDSGTVLLEYSLGEKRSYVWAVTSDSIKVFELPAREIIVGRSLKYCELLTARNRNPRDEVAATRGDRIKSEDDELRVAADKLSETILGPVAGELGTKRIVFVGDGAMSYIPFAALPVPGQSGKALRTAMAAEHEIVSLPSASILPLLREDATNRRPPSKLLAVFADPVFERSDSRLGSSRKRQSKENLAPTELSRAMNEAGLGNGDTNEVPRLPFSRREADSILRLTPPNESLRRFDFDASKQRVFDSGLDRFRIIHFATHGLLNTRNPELSGMILSLVDRRGDDADGFLRLQDVYNLKLSADLVVLSACSTALGKEVKGEGLIGLTRGFMYAGAPRVIASLWKVDDAATAAFMTIFYRKMLGENMRPAAALRAAQLDMMKTRRWNAPYYWAPFILQGEWR